MHRFQNTSKYASQCLNCIAYYQIFHCAQVPTLISKFVMFVESHV